MEEEIEEFEFKKPKVREINIDGDRVFISKSNFFGYKVVHPIKIDGKIVWKNLLSGGSWKNLIFIIILVLIILGAINEYSTAVNIANECLLKEQVINFPTLK